MVLAEQRLIGDGVELCIGKEVVLVHPTCGQNTLIDVVEVPTNLLQQDRVGLEHTLWWVRGTSEFGVTHRHQFEVVLVVELAFRCRPTPQRIEGSVSCLYCNFLENLYCLIDLAARDVGR